ncbi:MAG TPA: FAD-dependent monooxygenase [Polyangiaceae bacterium]|nr:FAD-dependent monooxygenase [Polyangiaceae bacterium]
MTRAVVVGGSIAGLLVGRVLAEVCDEVLVVERGELPDTPLPRAGVPQGHHAHGLLAGGLQALEQLLPGLCRELEERGCPTGDNLRDAAWIFSGRRLALGDSGVRGMTVARPLLDHVIQSRVTRLSNVHIRTGTRVTGLLHEAGRVTGLRVASVPGDEETLEADLVIDASGRHSELPNWLLALGLSAPRIEEITLPTHYASRTYARRPNHLNGAIAIAVVSDPKVPRGGVALALDRERWIVSLYSMGGERPPQDAAGFAQFARTLATPVLAEVLEDSEPLSETRTLRFVSSIRRHYDSMRDFPRGLLVCADALASFNPTFGQGITVAAKQALLLQQLGRRVRLSQLGTAFLESAAPIIDVAWSASAGRLFLYPGAVGRPTLKMRIANFYLPRVIASAHADPEIAAALLEVLHFQAPPKRLFAPGVMLRLLAGMRERGAADPRSLLARSAPPFE